MANLNNDKIKFENSFIVVENAGDLTDADGNTNQYDPYAFVGEENEGTADSEKKTIRFLRKYEGKYIAPTVTFGNENISTAKQSALAQETRAKKTNEKIKFLPAKSETVFDYIKPESDFYCNNLISYLYKSDGSITAYNITKAAKLMLLIEKFNSTH